jgi:hypothetical protein
VGISPDIFWGDNIYNHPPLTDEMLSFAERSLEVELPKKYVELLRVQNGGCTRGWGYPMNAPPKDEFDYWELEKMSGIIVNPKQFTLNILDTPDMTNEWGLPPRQVLLEGDGHTWISLDYRQGMAPKVIHIDAELGGETVIADSFDEFVDGLVPYSQMDGVESQRR